MHKSIAEPNSVQRGRYIVRADAPLCCPERGTATRRRASTPEVITVGVWTPRVKPLMERFQRQLELAAPL